jgi:hypothetical protein
MFTQIIKKSLLQSAAGLRLQPVIPGSIFTEKVHLLKETMPRQKSFRILNIPLRIIWFHFSED